MVRCEKEMPVQPQRHDNMAKKATGLAESSQEEKEKKNGSKAVGRNDRNENSEWLSMLGWMLVVQFAGHQLAKL